jgi:hypothetical protein
LDSTPHYAQIKKLKKISQNTQKNVGTFQLKMQVKANITKYVVLCTIPRNM